MDALTEPTPGETIAAGITKIADAMEELRGTGLKRLTLVVLLQHKTGLPMRDIGAVLTSLDTLAADWTD